MADGVQLCSRQSSGPETPAIAVVRSGDTWVALPAGCDPRSLGRLARVVDGIAKV
ncbi:hypothetical protein LI99_26985 [Mycolicibacterium smegmatis]|uniref:Uncharacterized protein n=1 Tax=Mycolicibacterium smegmatis (strain ATCC 700084 / mc(2)155) TaxID=246196 RepID=A0R3G0_MYCS2|nr:hypothetical protein MSMEG_5459 [Mycolicibacterium smegmatis MC2 155]AIU17103.1 hypothetical protein LI99_26985 [Mycolicibacterium smegmatis]AIU10478.1 hypothetical protein LJ00_26980 [Mycolicibacterium smegmatis MC2 155]AIU23726.1 hypothetical protein LI98_26990 [Mycolicibacterium smegmatis]TBH49106.1 hypothetical protein EYS45_06765 [Mycolicibacterium smegmatis MC2 155]